MNDDAKNEERREECPSEKRRCPKCGKVLAQMNPGPECYSCSVPLVVDIDKKGKTFRRPTTFKVIGLTSLCSSRETRGFNRVYYQYHGWGNGL